MSEDDVENELSHYPRLRQLLFPGTREGWYGYHEFDRLLKNLYNEGVDGLDDFHVVIKCERSWFLAFPMIDTHPSISSPPYHVLWKRDSACMERCQPHLPDCIRLITLSHKYILNSEYPVIASRSREGFTQRREYFLFIEKNDNLLLDIVLKKLVSTDRVLEEDDQAAFCDASLQQKSEILKAILLKSGVKDLRCNHPLLSEEEAMIKKLRKRRNRKIERACSIL